MTFTIRQIDPTTGTSTFHNTATLEAAFFMIAGIFDKHLTITDEDGRVLSEIYPIESNDLIDQQIAMLFPTL